MASVRTSSTKKTKKFSYRVANLKTQRVDGNGNFPSIYDGNSYAVEGTYGMTDPMSCREEIYEYFFDDNPSGIIYYHFKFKNDIQKFLNLMEKIDKKCKLKANKYNLIFAKICEYGGNEANTGRNDKTKFPFTLKIALTDFWQKTIYFSLFTLLLRASQYYDGTYKSLLKEKLLTKTKNALFKFLNGNIINEAFMFGMKVAIDEYNYNNFEEYTQWYELFHDKSDKELNLIWTKN